MSIILLSSFISLISWARSLIVNLSVLYPSSVSSFSSPGDGTLGETTSEDRSVLSPCKVNAMFTNYCSWSFWFSRMLASSRSKSLPIFTLSIGCSSSFSMASRISFRIWSTFSHESLIYFSFSISWCSSWSSCALSSEDCLSPYESWERLLIIFYSLLAFKFASTCKLSTFSSRLEIFLRLSLRNSINWALALSLRSSSSISIWLFKKLSGTSPLLCCICRILYSASSNLFLSSKFSRELLLLCSIEESAACLENSSTFCLYWLISSDNLWTS